MFFVSSYTYRLRTQAQTYSSMFGTQNKSGPLSFRNLQCWLLLDALWAAVGSVSVLRKLFSGSVVWVSYMCSPLFIHSLYWCPLCHSPGQYYLAVTLQKAREGGFERVFVGNNWLNVKWSNFRHIDLFIWRSLCWNYFFKLNFDCFLIIFESNYLKKRYDSNYCPSSVSGQYLRED